MKWATSVPILVFLGLSVLDLGPIYATDGKKISEHVSVCLSSFLCTFVLFVCLCFVCFCNSFN